MVISWIKKHFRAILSDFGRICCDFRLDITDFGKKCEIKGNKEKSRESGGSGQGKQPWGVGRYDVVICRLPENALSSPQYSFHWHGGFLPLSLRHHLWKTGADLGGVIGGSCPPLKNLRNNWVGSRAVQSPHP